MIIAYLVLLCVYLVLPIPLQIVAFIINTYISDPIPVVDELLMAYNTLNKIKKTINILNITNKIMDIWDKYGKRLIVGLILVFVVMIIGANIL